jgi:hypothetical protein
MKIRVKPRIRENETMESRDKESNEKNNSRKYYRTEIPGSSYAADIEINHTETGTPGRMSPRRKCRSPCILVTESTRVQLTKNKSSIYMC